MKEIVIAPLSTPETVTRAAWDAVLSARTLYLQTALHPSAAPVLREGLAFVSMDDLYEQAADFTLLHAAIAARLVSGTSCVYAVMGGGCYLQLPAIRQAAEQAGFSVRVLPGVSYAAAAFPDVQQASVVTAGALGRPDPDRALLIEELDHKIAAGECKLALLEYYPAAHPVVLATLQKDGRYRRRTFALCELDRQRTYGAASVLYVKEASFDARDRYDYTDLCRVIARLRAPGGCPWDREQTHESLKKPLIEECYELVDAIDGGDDAHLVEELGDVWMQVVMHAAIAAEQGRFTEHDVADAIVKKLVYRHPHVFGDVAVSGSAEVLKNWDALKRKEKHQSSETEVLMSVPRAFPALMRAQKVQKKAAKIGFDFASPDAAFDKIREESGELLSAMAAGEGTEREAGDLLFSAVNVIRLLGLDAEACMQQAADKFIGRFAEMERLAREDGYELSALSPARQDEYWEKAKKGLQTM